MRLRVACSGVLAVGLALGLVPLGCGGAEEEYTAIQYPQSEASSSNEWTVQEVVVEGLRGCVKKHASELKTYSHEAKFEVKVTEGGDVQQVKVRNSTLHHDALESCMMQALTTLSIPPSVLRTRSSGPVSGGESMRHERGPAGFVQALAGVAVGPVIIIAAGVTIGVYILAVTAEEALEAGRRQTKREKWCMEQLYRCVGSRNDCFGCLQECRRHGVWDEGKCPLGRPN